MKFKFKSFLLLSFVALSSFALTSCDKEENDNTPQDSTPSEDIIVKRTITFDTDGGNKIDNSVVNENEKVKKPADPKKDGYEFAGWYLGDNEFSFDTEITSDITLKAKYYKTQLVTETYFFDSNVSVDLLFPYDDSFFNVASNVYSKYISLFAFGASITSGSETSIKNYYQGFGFDDISFADSNNPNYGVAYNFAHKKVNNYDLITVTVRGVNYSTEWVGNFDIGTTGNHKNYDTCANTIVSSLKTYASKYSNIKLLITGYSRGGGIANRLADKILSDTDKITDNSNVYAYTFATPKGTDKNHATKYDNVFNIINSADLVTYVMPEEFGITRVGTDIDVYSSKVDKYLKDYNKDLVLNTFSPYSGYYTKETELPNFIINRLLSYTTDITEYEPYLLSTRENFVNNYTSAFNFIFGNILYGLSEETRAKLLEDIKGMAANNISQILLLISDKQNLHDFIKPYLDEDSITYDDADLLATCDTLIGFIQTSGSILLVFALEPNRSSIMRMISMHTSIPYYALIRNYETK